MAYIHKFQTESAFTESYNNRYVEPWVSYTVENQMVKYNKTEKEKLLGTELTFEALTDGVIRYSKVYQALPVEYKKNDGEWTYFDGDSSIEIPVVSGDTVQFRGNNNSYTIFSQSSFMYQETSPFTTTCDFNLKGNVMSMISSVGFAGLTSFPENSDHNFSTLFAGLTGLVDASELILPATTLSNYCYGYYEPGMSKGGMFRGCTSMIAAPALPATTLAPYCYDVMFSGCTSLTTAPELPATTLADYCYHGMFAGCTSLTTAPSLPATTLASGCYAGMFNNCTSLTKAPELPATTLANQCYAAFDPYLYYGMFAGCTSLTTAPSLPATTLASGCYAGMFRDCTSLTTAPSLPATTLEMNCYTGMFAGCTSLTMAPELPATTLASGCYGYDYSVGTGGGIFSGCTSLNYIKCLATDISARQCTNSWVDGVAASGTFVKSPNMTGWTTGNNGIPTGWTVVDAQ